MTSQNVPTSTSPTSLTGALAAHPGGAAIGAIWTATVLAAWLAPDLVSGSAQEHLPLAAITGWPWALTATVYVAMTTQGNASTRTAGFPLAIGAIWLAVAAISILAPTLVTGTDPTSIPLAAVIAPVLGMALTGVACIQAARAA